MSGRKGKKRFVKENQMLEQITQHLDTTSKAPALFLDGHYHTYGELAAKVASIEALIASREPKGSPVIGVMAHSDLETYASLLAILFLGYGYLPINPASPASRNAAILGQSGTRLLLTSRSGEPSLEGLLPGMQVVSSARCGDIGASVAWKTVSPAQYAYLLFTSGSTGVPKGVPITRGNLEAFLEGFFALGIELGPSDRVLQMFDLTFDFSVMSCFVPLVKGACLFPADANDLKLMSVYRLLEEEQITCAPMVPSVLAFLRPYFDEVLLEKLRYSIFCGEPLLDKDAERWASCAPNSRIINFYGPTEATVFCSAYDWTPTSRKSLNGAVSIGKPMRGTTMRVLDEQGQIARPNQSGEICLAGPQLTTGYWNDPQKNLASFFELPSGGATERYYRTGDLGFCDAEGDFMFQGRLDQQVKVQGFRVELAEIEHHARACGGVTQAVAVAVPGSTGATELVLCLDKFDGDTSAVLDELRNRIPGYMVPARIVTFPALPLNRNGKIDRPALRALVARSA